MSEAPSTTSPEAHDHDHDHPWFLGHHWENPQQQFEAGKLGMWLFLATEVLLFGGLFCGYAIWRSNHPELFEYGSGFLDTTMGAINTAVLIASSLTMAWAVTAAQQGKQMLLKILLVLTLCGAFGFLIIKYFEYTHKFDEGIYPGLAYYEPPTEKSHTYDAHAGVYVEPTVTIPAYAVEPDFSKPMTDAPTIAPASAGPAGLNPEVLASFGQDAGAEDGHESEDASDHAADDGHAADDAKKHHLQDPLRPRDAHMFFNIYFMMTGLHGIHVVLGIIVISWLLYKAIKGQFGKDYFTPVDLGGLYWHVVDLIWIFLFPLFYLI